MTWTIFHALTRLALLAAAASLAVALGSGAAAAIALPGLAPSLPGAWLALLVQLLGTVIGAFSARYLQGEAGQSRYVSALAGVLAAVQVAVAGRALAGADRRVGGGGHGAAGAAVLLWRPPLCLAGRAQEAHRRPRGRCAAAGCCRSGVVRGGQRLAGRARSAPGRRRSLGASAGQCGAVWCWR